MAALRASWRPWSGAVPWSQVGHREDAVLEPSPLDADATSQERAGGTLGCWAPWRVGHEVVEGVQKVDVPLGGQRREDRTVVARRPVLGSDALDEGARVHAFVAGPGDQPLADNVLVPRRAERAGEPPQLVAERLADVDPEGRAKGRKSGTKSPARHAGFVHATRVSSSDGQLGFEERLQLLPHPRLENTSGRQVATQLVGRREGPEAREPRRRVALVKHGVYSSRMYRATRGLIWIIRATCDDVPMPTRQAMARDTLRQLAHDVLSEETGAKAIVRLCPRCGSAQHGRPVARVEGGAAPEVSLSYARDLVAVAWSWAGRVGIDVEEVGPAVDGTDRREWTRHEAAFKAGRPRPRSRRWRCPRDTSELLPATRSLAAGRSGSSGSVSHASKSSSRSVLGAVRREVTELLGRHRTAGVLGHPVVRSAKNASSPTLSRRACRVSAPRL